MYRDKYHNPKDNFFAIQRPDNKVNVDDVAKANPCKICNCPGSEPGKVSADMHAHQPSCHIRGRLKSGRYTVNTSAIPRRINEGCSLGVAIGSEDF
jgi:hypothetical protein